MLARELQHSFRYQIGAGIFSSTPHELFFSFLNINSNVILRKFYFHFIEGEIEMYKSYKFSKQQRQVLESASLPREPLCVLSYT